MSGRLLIDGAHGEGGGQILRTALTFATLFQRPLRIENIRAPRRNPGLAAQHLTCIRAAGALCDARIEGDALGSGTLEFTPRQPARAGVYDFDVGQARKGGSAGATSLVLQTVLLPLALAEGESRLAIAGGTHLHWSPSFHFLRDAWLPALRRSGAEADLLLEAWGWFPVGKGLVRATIRGAGSRRLGPLELTQRGGLREVRGTAVAANLPAHIAERMAGRANARLRSLGFATSVEALAVQAACAGAGLFLSAHYDHVTCGFSALGARGKPAETVADEAVAALLAHHAGPGAVDAYLGDQILVALALADGASRYSVPRISGHLATNAWLVEMFGLARVGLEPGPRGGGLVTVTPRSG